MVLFSRPLGARAGWQPTTVITMPGSVQFNVPKALTELQPAVEQQICALIVSDGLSQLTHRKCRKHVQKQLGVAVATSKDKAWLKKIVAKCMAQPVEPAAASQAEPMATQVASEPASQVEESPPPAKSTARTSPKAKRRKVTREETTVASGSEAATTQKVAKQTSPPASEVSQSSTAPRKVANGRRLDGDAQLSPASAAGVQWDKHGALTFDIAAARRSAEMKKHPTRKPAAKRPAPSPPTQGTDGQGNSQPAGARRALSLPGPSEGPGSSAEAGDTAASSSATRQPAAGGHEGLEEWLQSLPGVATTR